MAVYSVENVRSGAPFVRIALPYGFDVAKIFDCGQCFRFNPVENTEFDSEYSGVAYGRFVSFAQRGEELYIFNSTQDDFENIWKNYLALDVDYREIERDISSHSGSDALDAAIEWGRGIRILRQESWEAICSFIISQNNNIPRIKKIIEQMSRELGEEIEIPEEYRGKLAGTSPYSFPSPEKLYEIGVDGIFALKVGFRAKYIYDASEKMLSGGIDIDFLQREKNTAECVKHLCGIKGVGPKVACCALLFGFAKYDAFPIDVWIKRAIEKYFAADAESFSPEDLGEYAGIAQQYLFYYERYIVSATEK